MYSGLLKRYHFLTEDRRTVIYVLDYNLCPALIAATKEHGPVYYKGHNLATDEPLEVPCYVFQRGQAGKRFIPFQYEIFQSVDS